VDAAVVRFEVVGADSAPARWCLDRYESELAARFDGGFDATVAIPASPEAMCPPRGVFVVGRAGEELVACGGVKDLGDRVADLKRMWVAPTARGVGLGARLLAELENQAIGLGHRVVQLETNRALREAIDLYRRAGYVEGPAHNDEPHAHHWFRKVLATD